MTGTTGRSGGRGDGARMVERLSAWAGARVAPDAADAVRALEQVSGQRPELASKRSLIAVSHAIERAVLAAPRADPTIVLALFQRMEYFERERAVYERIARAGARVAVGFCDGPEHELPEGVSRVVLQEGGPLVDEWAVVAVTPQAGAFLVATDQHDFAPGAVSLEAGRQFRSRWGFSRVQATVELARLRLVLGERLPADMVRTVDRLLGETMSAGADPASSAGTPQEVWSTTAAFHLAERLSSARTGSARLRAQLAEANAAASARQAAGTDQQSGLTTPDFLRRWSDSEGTTVLPVGIGLFALPAVAQAGRDGDHRAAYHAARRIAAAVTEPLGPVDAAVRLSESEFLIVLPGASELHLARVCDEILEQLTLASDGYPYVALSGTLATTVTRYRPLPIEDLRAALARDGDNDDPGPRSAGTTGAGDAIVVCATRPVAPEEVLAGGGPARDGGPVAGGAPARDGAPAGDDGRGDVRDRDDTRGGRDIGGLRDFGGARDVGDDRDLGEGRGDGAGYGIGDGSSPGVTDRDRSDRDRDRDRDGGRDRDGRDRDGERGREGRRDGDRHPDGRDRDAAADRIGQQVLGYGRFPRPYPADRGGSDPVDPGPGADQWETGPAAVVDPYTSAVDRDTTPTWSSLGWTDPGKDTGSIPAVPDADRDGERESRRARRDDTVPPGTAVDEVRNLFGRRN